MGIIAVILIEKTGAPGRMSAFLMTGVLGGFTTFSAFSLDALALFEAGRFGAAGAYVIGSVTLSVLALALGLWAGRGLL